MHVLKICHAYGLALGCIGPQPVSPLIAEAAPVLRSPRRERLMPAVSSCRQSVHRRPRKRGEPHDVLTEYFALLFQLRCETLEPVAWS